MSSRERFVHALRTRTLKPRALGSEAWPEMEAWIRFQRPMAPLEREAVLVYLARFRGSALFWHRVLTFMDAKEALDLVARNTYRLSVHLDPEALLRLMRVRNHYQTVRDRVSWAVNTHGFVSWAPEVKDAFLDRDIALCKGKKELLELIECGAVIRKPHWVFMGTLSEWQSDFASTHMCCLSALGLPIKEQRAPHPAPLALLVRQCIRRYGVDTGAMPAALANWVDRAMSVAEFERCALSNRCE